MMFLSMTAIRAVGKPTIAHADPANSGSPGGSLEFPGSKPGRAAASTKPVQIGV